MSIPEILPHPNPSAGDRGEDPVAVHRGSDGRVSSRIAELGDRRGQSTKHRAECQGMVTCTDTGAPRLPASS
jgi:hypothetical protein